MRRLTKTGAATLAFVPGVVVILNLLGVIPYSTLVKSAQLFDYPAVGLTALWMGFNPNRVLAIIFLLVTMCLWSTLIAIVFWRIAGLFLSEEEIEGQKFDWAGFQVRFFIGFLIGFLFGWRFVRYSDGRTILIAMVVCGIFGGLLLGAWKEDFWARPL